MPSFSALKYRPSSVAEEYIIGKYELYFRNDEIVHAMA